MGDAFLSIFSNKEFGMTIEKIYTNSPGTTDPGAYTITTKYPDYKAIYIVNVIADGTTLYPATGTLLMKGDSIQCGCAWGQYYGRRTYTFASDGTVSWDAYTSTKVNPVYIYAIK